MDNLRPKFDYLLLQYQPGYLKTGSLIRFCRFPFYHMCTVLYNTYLYQSNLQEEKSEPVPKKKKLFLKPPQKKMSLMGSLKKKEKETDGDDIEITINEDSGR